jgi:cold shock CspA family protein
MVINKDEAWNNAVKRALTQKDDLWQRMSQLPATAVPDTNQQTGVVKWFDRRRGWGFIVPNDGGLDLFAHYDHINDEPGLDGRKNLADGDRVQFSVTANPNGRYELHCPVCGLSVIPPLPCPIDVFTGYIERFQKAHKHDGQTAVSEEAS